MPIEGGAGIGPVVREQREVVSNNARADPTIFKEYFKDDTFLIGDVVEHNIRGMGKIVKIDHHYIHVKYNTPQKEAREVFQYTDDTSDRLTFVSRPSLIDTGDKIAVFYNIGKDSILISPYPPL